MVSFFPGAAETATAKASPTAATSVAALMALRIEFPPMDF
jgi:hypothetical protein